MCVQAHENANLESESRSSAALSAGFDDELLCHHCDLLVSLPALKDGERATCPRCHTVLYRKWAKPNLLPVSYAVSALFMLFIALLFPFVDLQVSGNYNQINLREIPTALISDNYSSLAVVFMISVQLIPIFCMVSMILLCLNFPLSRAMKRAMARLLFILKPWCMVEIFLAGVVVSFVKLIAYGDIGVGLSFVPYCLFCLLQIKAFNSIDPRWLWRQIARPPKIYRMLEIGETGARQGLRLCQCCFAILPAAKEKCPRCHARGSVRRRDSLQWTMALLVTSAVLYIPANVLPIMITVALGDSFSSTILSGVISMWNDGSYPVAMIIFIASILIPSLKIFAIAWLCLYAKGVGRRHSEHMHLIYEVVEFVGRWSMIDIFVIALLSALVRMNNLMGVFPDIGALFFALVVILTMISAAMFDPRLIWDRAPVSMKKEASSAGK
jgi:paraquat-inducible protein A